MVRHKKNAQKSMAVEYMYKIQLEAMMTKYTGIHKIKNYNILKRKLEGRWHVHFKYNKGFFR